MNTIIIVAISYKLAGDILRALHIYTQLTGNPQKFPLTYYK